MCVATSVAVTAISGLQPISAMTLKTTTTTKEQTKHTPDKNKNALPEQIKY